MEYTGKLNDATVDHDLARILEVHGDAIAHIGLHLPKAPVGLVGVADQHAGFKKGIHDGLLLAGAGMSGRADLTALIGSRICHDLISPIGAIGNGVELLMMDGGARGPEVALIAESVAHANARIRYFRVAFGAAGQDMRMARNEVASILGDLSQGTRTAIDWSSPSDLARSEVKLAFLSVMCCETAMPFGGRIHVGTDGGRWTVTGTAQRLKVDPALWELLSNPAADRVVTPAEVHFALLTEEIGRQHRQMVVEIDATSVRIAF